MRRHIRNLFLATVLFLFYPSIILAADTHFIDFTKVLNSSKAGEKAQKNLKNKFQAESNKYKKMEENIKKEEVEIISQKKALSPEDYRKKVESLRNKVSELQKNKQKSLNNIAKSRNDAKKKLLEVVNPIIKKYMEDNNVRIVLDKKAVVLGDEKLEITNQIIVILNKKLPSLKIN